MSDKPDVFEAARTVASALKPFDKTQQMKIIRWACDEVGIGPPVAGGESQVSSPSAPLPRVLPSDGSTGTVIDIKTFMKAKQPRTENQFAAAVAYYYRFEAPETDKKDEINADDVTEAVRLVDRDRIRYPQQVLINVAKQGFVDRGSGAGLYKINLVGENLVAKGLPGGDEPPTVRKKTAKKAIAKKRRKKKTANKKTAKKTGKRKKGLPKKRG